MQAANISIQKWADSYPAELIIKNYVVEDVIE